MHPEVYDHRRDGARGLAARICDLPDMSHGNSPTTDIDRAAVQAACAATLYELLCSGWRQDRHRHRAHVPAVLAELKRTPTWRKVLVAAAWWMRDEGTSAPAFLRPRGYETSLFSGSLEVSYPRT